MKELSFILKKLLKGKSVTRAYLDHRLSQETLRGKTIDIGGGRNDLYVSFIPKSADVQFVTFDVKAGDNAVDFETDSLPTEDDTYDTVLFLNVMEHIFNYQNIANEVIRITKADGQLIGFVPFLMWYHADPRDFFRYTHEALENILRQAGAQEVKIEPIGAGPFVAAAQMFIQSIPVVFLRPVIFIPFYFLDKLFFYIKRERKRVYALGYYFVCSK